MGRLAGMLAMVVVLATAASGLAHPPARLSAEGEKGVAEEIAHFRKLVAEAVAAKDRAKLRHFFADGFVHTLASGKTEGRDEHVAALMTGEPAIETATVEGLVIRTFAGGWMGVATGLSPIRSKTDGVSERVRWTVVYSRTETSWQIVASHATRVSEAAK